MDRSGNVNVSEIPLEGEWIGHYTGHYDEVIKLRREGNTLYAVKVTGDDYVPAGEITWRVDVLTGKGEGQVAEKEFRNPRFIPGHLTVLAPERIQFHWENCGTVEYRKDD
jgi:hypothetical protein